jgi:hypothetical protein
VCQKPVYGLLILALGISACSPFAARPLPTQPPGWIETVVAGTAQASMSETAAALPTSTPPRPIPTATKTPPPPTETATPSPTFIFLLPTMTPTIKITVPSGGGGGSGPTKTPVSTTCQLVDQSPKNGTVVPPQADFDMLWQVKNISTQTWIRSDTDLVYISGPKMQKYYDIIDLEADVKPGEIVDLGVDMIAPLAEGTYTIHWALKVGTQTLCDLYLTLQVKK